MIHARPQLGRSFGPHDETPAADPVAVLSHSAWLRQFAGAADVVGQRLTLDGRAYSVIGVMPAAFEFPDRQTQVWTPYVLGGNALRGRESPVARLADGVSLQAATSEVRSIVSQLQTSANRAPDSSRIELRGVHDLVIRPVEPALRLLTAAVVFVLLIACVNVANLLLARTTSRTRELAVRASLGAGRARLVRQLLTEAVVLGLAGGVAGAVMAVGGVALIRRLGAVLPRRDLAADIAIPRLQEIDIDLRVLLFAVIVAIGVGLLSGAAPALRWLRRRDADALREGASSTGGGFDLLGRQSAQGLLVVAEIAMAMVLLVGGGLLVHSFVKLTRVNPGYDATNVITFAVYSAVMRPGAPPPGATSSSPIPAPPPLDDFLARLKVLPRVEAASYAELLPLVRFRSGMPLRTTPEPPARPPAPGTKLAPQPLDARIVHRDYLKAMGMRVVEGRDFGDGDTEGQPKVMLINRTLARSGFLGPNPIGTRVYAAGKAPWEIVGIVEDVRQYGLDQNPDPQIFIDGRQLPVSNPNPYFVVRTSGDPAALLPEVRLLARQFDRDAVVDNVATMDQLLANSLTRPRLYAVLLGLFAAVAAALAALGIYGVMAYAVTRRAREFGIRLALGATAGEVLGLVLRQSLVLTAAGIFVGLCGVWIVGRRLEGMLFGLSPFDPATLAAVALLFAGVAVIAALIPASRATCVDPVSALKAE